MIAQQLNCLLLICIFLIVGGCNSSARQGQPTVPLFESLLPTPTPTATPGPVIERPSGAIFINPGACSCLSGVRDSLGNCDSFCSNKTSNVPTLFGSVSLGIAVESDSLLGNLHNWCTVEIPGDVDANGNQRTNPGCVLQASDGLTTINLPMVTSPGSNSFTAELNLLNINTPYVLKIVESGSGGNAESDSTQLRRLDPPDTTDSQNLGPLRVMPVHRYTCLTRSGGSDGTGDIFENAIRLYFYYEDANDPQPLTPGDNFIFCHDINEFGNNDSPLFPRLEVEEQSFYVWNQTDPRFFDTITDQGTSGNNGVIDINDIIKNRLEEEFNVTSGGAVTVFTEFPWPNSPDTTADNTPRVGFVMIPFVDNNTGRGFCPTQIDYNGNRPIFKLLKELVGVDTEAIYFAEKEPEVFTDSDGNTQTVSTLPIIIRESLLRQIAFFTEGGNVIAADDSTFNSKTIKFFFPADTTSPFIQKPYQKIYTVRSADNLGGNNTPTIPTSIRPPDKRFACVPKTN